MKHAGIVGPAPAEEALGQLRGVKLFERILRNAAAAPFIYAMAVPVAILDASISLYQALCFRLWGIAPAKRAAHILIDRGKLAYLNPVQKFNCIFCAYANGVLAYGREVAARTEQYWCPIQHENRPAEPHDRYDAFAPYGDARAFRLRAAPLRDALLSATERSPRLAGASAPRTVSAPAGQD